MFCSNSLTTNIGTIKIGALIIKFNELIDPKIDKSIVKKNLAKIFGIKTEIGNLCLLEKKQYICIKKIFTYIILKKNFGKNIRHTSWHYG